jgi:hypothetical protein
MHKNVTLSHRLLNYYSTSFKIAMKLPKTGFRERALPEWAHWDFYMDLEQASIFSEVFYHKPDAGRTFTGG